MKIKIHETLILLILLGFLSGFIQKLVFLFLVIFFHEMGHLIALGFFKREIKEVNILPFGAIINYQDLENKKLDEELIISSAGIIINIIILLISNFFVFRFINSSFYEINKLILFFNLLPIWPLDGGRIVEVLLSYKINFKNVMDKFIVFSFFVLLGLGGYLFIFKFSINGIIVFSYLFLQNIYYLKNRKIRYKSFLLKKYLNENKSLKLKIIRSKPYIDRLYKGYNNFTLRNTEKDILNDYFKKNVE